MLKELCTCTNVICIFNLYMLTFEFVPIEPHKKLELGACQAGIFYLSLQHMQQGFRKDSCTQQERGESSWYGRRETDVSRTLQTLFPPALPVPKLALEGMKEESEICPEPLHAVMLRTALPSCSSPQLLQTSCQSFSIFVHTFGEEGNPKCSFLTWLPEFLISILSVP